MSSNLRQAVHQSLCRVIIDGQSGSQVLSQLQASLEAQQRPLAKELYSGVLERYWHLAAICKQWLKQPLKRPDQDLLIIIILGLYQLWFTRAADHAVLNETVALCDYRNKGWAKNLVNALLRRGQRQKQDWHNLKVADYDRANLPKWLWQQIQDDWQGQAETVIAGIHQRPPLTLRVNSLQISDEDFTQALTQAGMDYQVHPWLTHCLHLTSPVEVTTIPGYDQGWFSVQDAAAQCAAWVVDPQVGEEILDACAAPGGKTSHLLEHSSGLARVVAVDSVAERLDTLKTNLARLQLQADVRQGDAIQPEAWCHDNERFDKILCDAPCSATGIIRRHPDIAHHRTLKDIRQLTNTQWRLLKALWARLKPGGILVYSTCSILKAENTQMITDFLKHNADAQLTPFTIGTGNNAHEGLWQIAPGEDHMDGFFYAKLQKADN